MQVIGTIDCSFQVKSPIQRRPALLASMKWNLKNWILKVNYNYDDDDEPDVCNCIQPIASIYYCNLYLPKKDNIISFFYQERDYPLSTQSPTIFPLSSSLTHPYLHSIYLSPTNSPLFTPDFRQEWPLQYLSPSPTLHTSSDNILPYLSSRCAVFIFSFTNSLSS